MDTLCTCNEDEIEYEEEFSNSADLLPAVYVAVNIQNWHDNNVHFAD